jgi:glycosyltransferase involved in cell wall biosynthesis
MAPSVSVVVPTYNRARLLDETLRAILAQTIPVHEIIVVDDGSTDDTAQVCARQPKHVRYLRQDNTGLPAFARNLGIASATGDWIAFCDSDDQWHPRKVEVQLGAIEAASAQWSVTGFGLIDPDGLSIPVEGAGFAREFPVFKQLKRTPRAHFAQWLSRTTIASSVGDVEVFAGDAFGMLFEGNVCLMSTAMVARSLIDRAGPFDPAFMAEDTEFFHRIAAHGPVAVVLHPLLSYRVGHASMMSARDLSPFIRSALRSIDAAAQLRTQMDPAERRAYRRGRERLRMRLAYERLSSLDRPGARRVVIDGWRTGEMMTPRAVALFLAALVPAEGLKTLHAMKRRLGAAKRSRLETRGRADEIARVRSDTNDYRPPSRDSRNDGDAE